MKIMKKINDCFVALALTTFVCVGPTVMPAFAADIENQGQTEEPLVSTQEAVADDTTDSTSEDAPLEETSTEEQDDSTADETSTDEASTDEEAAQTMMAPAEDAAEQAVAAAEAEDPYTFNVATADELKAAFEKIDSGAAGTYTVNLAADVLTGDSLSVSSGKAIDLNGNGHTLTLDNGATLGAQRGTLNLDGGLTIAAAGSHDSALVTVNGGILNMSDGVTITGNTSNATGGGVYLSNKATFNMNGGTIENNQAHQGGGVYMDRGTTFNMNGGTIRDNLADNVGGGVYVNTRSTFTMSGSASIVDNTANAAGGVMNYGLATLTTVYNNTTHNGAADIFNNGRMKLSPTNPDWVLSSTGTNVTGWYIDNYSSTDENGNQNDGNHRWDPAAEDSVEYVPTAGETREELHLVAGAPLPEEPRISVIWENMDGTILYTMSNVKESEVPAADEYNELSGNADPTEPETSTTEYIFDNWEEYEDSQGDVIYKADYFALPKNAPIVPDEQIDIEDPDAPIDAVPSDAPSVHNDPAVIPSSPDDPANVPSTHDDSTTGPEAGKSGDNGDATENENEVDVQDEKSDDTDSSDGDDANSSTAPKMNDTGMATSLAATGGMIAGLAGIACIQRRRNEKEL